jgi:carbon storage regulator CsrA
VSRLVLSRAANERVRLFIPDGGQISLVVLRIGNGVVRVGVDAPPEIAVWREELVPGVLRQRGALHRPTAKIHVA